MSGERVEGLADCEVIGVGCWCSTGDSIVRVCVSVHVCLFASSIVILHVSVLFPCHSLCS